jgi:hypothetical protein
MTSASTNTGGGGDKQIQTNFIFDYLSAASREFQKSYSGTEAEA